MELQAEKAGLRQRFKQERQKLSQEYREKAGQAICAAVLALPQTQAAKTIFCYVSIGDEVDTGELITAALAAGKRVCVPKTWAGGTMQARQITGLQELQPAAFGLLEPPEDAPLVPPAAIDLVVVPALACDETGCRLGYGGGYYDRFLPQAGGTTLCLCYATLLQKKLPGGPLDVPVQLVVTEKAVLQTTPQEI